jgi:hypothetical protein
MFPGIAHVRALNANALDPFCLLVHQSFRRHKFAKTPCRQKCNRRWELCSWGVVSTDVIHPVTMNAPKVDELDYIVFLMAAQRVFIGAEAASCQPEQPEPSALNAFTRLLSRQPPDTTALWQVEKSLVRRGAGALLLDDSTLDKPYA